MLVGASGRTGTGDPRMHVHVPYLQIGQSQIPWKNLLNPTAKYVNGSATANTNMQVPDDLSRMIVTVSTLQPLDVR